MMQSRTGIDMGARQGRGGRRAMALAALLALAACDPGGDLKPLAEYKPEGYRLGGGDQLRIIIYSEDQLTGEYRIDDQGRLAIPLLGGMQANGLTPQQLEAAIAAGLRKRDLLRDPSVSVEVLAYRPIFVLGEVAKPGQYQYEPGMTMLTAIAVAGGFTYRAVQDYASDVRTTDNVATEGLVTPRSFISPGDVVRVYERRF